MLKSPGPRRLAAAAILLLVLGLPLPASAGDQFPCPLDAHDYGSEWEWGIACVDHFAGQGAGGGGQQVCELVPNPLGIPIVCVHDDFGWWSNSVQCYLRPSSPQPPAGDPVWGAASPDDGAIYQLTCPWFEGLDGLPYWELSFHRFFPAHTGFLGELVERAVGQLVITGPDIRMAPDPDGTGLVGLPVWMWTAVNPQTWSPDPLSLSALGSTVVVEAGVEQIVWDMGNGDTVVCDQGPGTPYQDQYGAQRSPDCGYDGYAWPSRDQPHGAYQVTATTHWAVRWHFEGTSVRGTEAAQRQSSTSVRINELQVVTS